MWMISSLLHILFPPSCLGCTKENNSLCERCLKLSRRTLSSAHPYIHSTFDFRDPLIKQTIHAIKYRHRRDLIAPFIPEVASSLAHVPDLETYILVPIPMPRLRKLLRGYNQSEYIAKALGKAMNLEVDTTLLVRTRNPLRQATLKNRGARTQNQKGTFKANSHAYEKRIILVDDVTTTGATLSEARNALLAAGALHIEAVTIAH